MPFFAKEMGKDWEVLPGKEWEWKEYSTEARDQLNARGYGSVTWVSLEDDVVCAIYVIERCEDPEEFYRVTLTIAPAYYDEYIKRHGQK